MSKKTVTFKVSDALKATQLDPNGCVTLTLQKSKKQYTCTYLDMEFKAGNCASNGLWIRGGGIKGAPNSGGFVIVAGVLDSEKAKEKFKDDPENQRMRITTNVSKSGDLGAFSIALTPIFKGKVEALAATGVIVIKNRTINGFAQTHISDESKNVEIRGQAIEDPLIRFVIDLSAPKEWYRKGFAWGKTVTQFLDYNKQSIEEDANGNQIVVYGDLTWTNDKGEEEPISTTNIHRVITAGSIVHEYTIWYGNPSISKSYVSSKATMTRCVIEVLDNTIETVAEVNFGDATVTPTVTPTEQQPVVVVTTDDAITDEALNDLLG